jgi:two-component system chemotaxis sensor kinase CheA
MSEQQSTNWERRAGAAEKTVELLKRKVVELYDGGSQSIISKQLERAKQRDAANQRRRELLEVRQQEMARYTEVLEGQVEERTRAIRTILDNVTFGFLLVDREVRVAPGFTASCASLFDRTFDAGVPLAELLRVGDREAVMLESLVDQVFEDMLPEEVSLDQLPRRFEVGPRALQLEAKVVRSDDGRVESMLISVSDVTALEAAQAEAQRNGAIISILSKRAAFTRFVADTRQALDEAAETDDDVVLRRLLHTVKGNAASWGLIEVSQLVHAIEEQNEIGASDVNRVHAEMERFLDGTRDVVGVAYRENSEGACAVERSQVRELRRILDEIDDEAHGQQLRQWAANISLCPASDLMGPLEVFVERLAVRLGKDVDLTVLGAETLVDPESTGPVFRNLTHLLRNALDHGIEGAHERGEKPSRGSIEIEVTSTDDAFEVTVTDDGRGIDVERLASKAIRMGVATETSICEMSREELLGLVFFDGLSSAEQATEISGRGVGMAAIRSAARTRGGRVDITSTLGKGTQIAVRVPKPEELRQAA